jgi:hypothetical protein
MKKILMVSLGLLTITIMACGLQTAIQTPPPPATTTLTAPQPTQPPTSTNTPPPLPTTTDVFTPTTEAQTQASPANVSFMNDVLPIFNNSCTKCHGVEQIKEGLDLRTYEGVIAGSFNGPVINPGNANDSYLVQQLIDGEMPKRGPKLTSQQIQTIIDWINTGALNN